MTSTGDRPTVYTVGTDEERDQESWRREGPVQETVYTVSTDEDRDQETDCLHCGH